LEEGWRIISRSNPSRLEIKDCMRDSGSRSSDGMERGWTAIETETSRGWKWLKSLPITSLQRLVLWICYKEIRKIFFSNDLEGPYFMICASSPYCKFQTFCSLIVLHIHANPCADSEYDGKHQCSEADTIAGIAELLPFLLGNGECAW